MKVVNRHVDQGTTRKFKDMGLYPCVDSLGQIKHLYYSGNLSFEIETDLGLFCARFEDDGPCIFKLAGYLKVMLPDVDGSLVLFHDIRILCALFRVGIFKRTSCGIRDCPDAVGKGSEIPLPVASVAWKEIGEKYRLRLCGKDITYICNNLVNVDIDGYVLYNPEYLFQSRRYLVAEDRLMMTILRVSQNGPGYAKMNRCETILQEHVSRYCERVDCHRRLVEWMMEAENIPNLSSDR